MQLDAGVVRPREAATAQAAGRHIEVASVLLHHHVGGHLRRAEYRMRALIDAECLGDAVRERGVSIVPAGRVFDQRDLVGRIAVDLVRAHMHEWRLRRMPARGLEKIERSYGIDVEILEWTRGRQIVAGLGGVWTITEGRSVRTSSNMPSRFRMSCSW